MAEGGFLPPVVARLVADTHGFATKMAEARGEMTATSSHGSSAFQNMAKVGQTALLGIGTAAVGIGAISLKMADDFEHAHARLENAVKNTGHSFKEIEEPLGRVEKKMENYGFTNAEVESGLAKLARTTHDPTKALHEMGLAADIARGRGIDLEAATQILVKVESGHVGALGRLGIATKDATGHTISQEEAIRRLTAMYGGQAQKTAGTFAGQMEALKAKSADMAKEIGMALIPILQKLVSIVLDVVKWLEKHKEVLIALGIIVGTVLVAAIIQYTIAMYNAAVATLAATWPILAIIAAIAILVTGIVLLWTHWDQVWNWIRGHPAIAVIIAILLGPFLLAIFATVAVVKFLWDNWRTIWSAIQVVISVAWAIISPILQLAMFQIQILIGIVQFLWSTWQFSWNLMMAIISGAWGVISGIFSGIQTGVGWIINAIQTLVSIWQAEWDAVSSAVSAAWNVIGSIFDAIVSALHTIADLASKVGDALGKVKDLGSDLAHTGGAANPLNWDTGGWVPGPRGAPVFGVVHGGEYVLTADEADALRGHQSSNSGAPAPASIDAAALDSAADKLNRAADRMYEAAALAQSGAFGRR